MMSTHARLSPSSRHRWAVCPGSVREEAKYPKERSGPAAIDGTHSHTLLEYCVKNDHMNPSLMVGKTLKDHDGEFVVDQARADRVAVAIEYIDEAFKGSGGEVRVIAETRVDPKNFTRREDLSGTVDVQIVADDILEIIDYKDGMNPVPAENNLQLEQYAIGALAEYGLGWDTPEMYTFDEVWMTIIQPKLALKGMEPISTWVVPVSHLLDRVKVLTDQARATDDPNAPLVPGETQCRYCRAKGNCNALANNVMKEVGVMFQKSIEVLDVAQQSATQEPSTMDDEKLRQIMEAAPLLRQLLDGVEEEIRKRLESGKSFPGFKLVKGRGSRSWSLPDDQVAEKLRKMGVPKESVYVSSVVSPAQVEKLTWEKKDGTKVSLSARQIEMIQKEYVIKKDGKPTLVPESDSRPAVSTDVSSLFSAVEVPKEPLPSWLM